MALDFLSKYKTVTRTNTATKTPAHKFTAKIDEQLAVYQNMEEGKVFEKPRNVREGEKTIKKVMPVIGWFTRTNGIFVGSVKYGRVKIEFPGHTGKDFEFSSFAEVRSFLNELRASTLKGELDNILKIVAKKPEKATQKRAA